MKPNVKEFAADGNSVTFEDGSTVDRLDCVLMATGFTVAFPYLSDQIIPVNDNRVGRAVLRGEKTRMIHCRFAYINTSGHRI